MVLVKAGVFIRESRLIITGVEVELSEAVVSNVMEGLWPGFRAM